MSGARTEVLGGFSSPCVFRTSVRARRQKKSPRANLADPRARQNGFQKKKWGNFLQTSSSYESSVAASQHHTTPPVAAPNEEEKNPKVGRGRPAPSTAISTPVRVARGYKTPRVGLRAFGFRWRTFPSWRRARTLDAQRVVEVLGKENHADCRTPLSPRHDGDLTRGRREA